MLQDELFLFNVCAIVHRVFKMAFKIEPCLIVYFIMARRTMSAWTIKSITFVSKKSVFTPAGQSKRALSLEREGMT